MDVLTNFLGKFLPEKSIGLIIIILCFGLTILIIRYNVEILRAVSNFFKRLGIVINKTIGRQVVDFNKRMSRATYLGQNDVMYDVYNFFEVMTTNLDLKREGVTSMGLLIFVFAIALIMTIVTSIFLKANVVLWLLILALYIFVEITMMRLLALTKTEKRENQIMDAMDMLCSDISGGVKNAIVKYKDSDAFHPDIRGYFNDFIDNIDNKGYSFKDAMLILNDYLGPIFCDFAYKAILYEEKADDNLVDIFSSIIEIDRQRRIIRQKNAIIFNSVRIQFLISLGMIIFYAVFSAYSDPQIYTYFTETTWGKGLVLADVAVVFGVLYIITSIKAKSL